MSKPDIRQFGKEKVLRLHPSEGTRTGGSVVDAELSHFGDNSNAGFACLGRQQFVGRYAVAEGIDVEGKTPSKEGTDEASDGLDQKRAVAGTGFEESSACEVRPLRPANPVEQAFDQPLSCIDPTKTV